MRSVTPVRICVPHEYITHIGSAYCDQDYNFGDIDGPDFQLFFK